MSELKTQNITETDIAFGKIANGLQSAASDHILGIAKDIYDTKQKAYQEDINEYLLNKVDGYTGGGNCDCEDITNAILEKDILTEVTIGGIEQGVTLEAGMTFTEFVERLFTIIYYGSIGDISRNGYVEIGIPEITVEKYENNKWVSISNNAIVKENTQVRVIVSNIPESILKDYFGVMYKSGNVLAYGWLKSVDGGEPVDGSGNCEIGATYATSGNDNLTIPIHSGCFSSLSVNSDTGLISFNTTVPSASNTNTTQAGQFSVRANSKSFQIKSDKNYTIYAKSSKDEDVNEIPEKRIRNVGEGENIGQPLSSSATSNTFTLNVEGWGLVPSKLTTGGNVSIKAPEIKVTKSDGTEVNSGAILKPTDEITVNVGLVGESEVNNPSVYLQKTTSTFQYGWEKIKGSETAVPGSGNCEIGTILSRFGDVLEFTGTKTGLFNDSNFKIENNKISFTKIVGNDNSEFNVVAKSGKHELKADDNYKVYALSSIGSSGESINMNNHFSCNKNDVLGNYNTKMSSTSRFYFNIEEELWSNIPTISRTGGVVTFGNPSISVTKSDGTPLSSPAELDPSDKLNITITLPQQSTISTPTAYYTPNSSANQLKYGWKLIQNGVETTGTQTDTCNIELKYTNESDTHTITGSGAFEGLSTTTLTKTGVSVGTGGSLTISSKHGTYTISPKYNECKIYALSSFGNTDENHLQTPPSKTITGTAKTATFTYTVKASTPATYSPFFYWGIAGGIDQDAEWDDANPTNIYEGEVRTLLDSIIDNISDEELSNMGMTKYNASEHSYSGGRMLDKGTFLVMLTNDVPNLAATQNGPNGITDNWHLIKTISRNGEVYKIYLFPDEPSAGFALWYDFRI